MAGQAPRVVLETRCISTLAAWLSSWASNAANCYAVVYGPPGSGKTTCIAEAARRSGRELVTLDSYSFSRDRARHVLSSGFTRRRVVHVVVEYDEAHGRFYTGSPSFWDRLFKSLARARGTLCPPVPVVFETDRPERLGRLASHGLQVRADPPRLSDIARLVREEAERLGVRVDLSGLPRSVPLALARLYGVDAREQAGGMTAVLRYINTGDASGLRPSHAPTVLDTVARQSDALTYHVCVSALLSASIAARVFGEEAWRAVVEGACRSPLPVKRIDNTFYELLSDNR